MRLATSLSLVALLAIISAPHLVVGEQPKGDPRINNLCFQITVKRTVCDILKSESEKGGNKKANFASDSKKACDTADRLNAIRLDYIKQNGIHGEDECDKDNGYETGKAVAEQMIINTRSGRLSGKLYNFLLS